MPYAESGLKLTLQSANRHSVSPGMPITYRGIRVGKVNSIQLSELADRVLVSISIENKYAHLVRENTVFWNETGIDLSVGLAGADIRTGSLQTLMTGGIAFNTPQKQPLKPVAVNNDAYLLHQEKDPEWDEWNQPIPSP